MRCTRVCGFCILIVLNLTPHAGSSSSPILHGDGIFGSPVRPSVHIVPLVGSRQSPAPPIVDGSVVPPSVTPQKNWQDIQARLPMPPYPSEGSAAIVSRTAAQSAGSPQLPMPQPDITLAGPAEDPFSSVGQPTRLHRPSPTQARPVTPSTTSIQPAPPVNTTPTIYSSTPLDKLSVPSTPSNVPQPKRTGPWLFSATREKLLGAINFMKATEEPVSHLYQYHTGGAPESLSKAGSSPRDHHPQAQMIETAAISSAVGHARGEIGTDSGNLPGLVQTHPYATESTAAQKAAAAHPGQKSKSINQTAPHTVAHSTDVALGTSEAMYSDARASAPQSPLLELLQRPQQLEHLQQGHHRGPQHQELMHLSGHGSLPSEEQAAVHLHAEREHGKLARQYQEVRGMLLAPQQIEATQHAQGIHPQSIYAPQSQYLRQRQRPGAQQHAVVQVALPAAGFPPYTPGYPAHAGPIQAAAAAPYVIFSGSGYGNTLLRDIRVGEGDLRVITPPNQPSSGPATRKSVTPSAESFAGQTRLSMGTSTQQVVRPHGAEAAESETFRWVQTSPGKVALQRFQTKSQEREVALTDNDTVVYSHDQPQNYPDNTSEVASRFPAAGAHRAEEQAEPAENSVSTHGTSLLKSDQAEAAHTSTSKSTEIFHQGKTFTVKIAEGETRFQEGADRSDRGSNGDVPKSGPIAVEKIIQLDAEEVKFSSKTARTPVHKMTPDAAAIQVHDEHLNIAPHGGSEGPDRAVASSTPATTDLGDLLLMTRGYTAKRHVEEKPANATSSATGIALPSIPDATSQSVQNAAAGSAPTKAMKTTSAPPTVTNGDADVATPPSVSLDPVVPVLPSQLNGLPASLDSTSPVTSPEVIPPGDLPSARSASISRQGTPVPALLVASTPQSTSPPPEQSMPHFLAPGLAGGNPAAVLFAPFLPGKEVTHAGAGPASEAIAPNMGLHTGMPVTVTSGIMQHNPAYISPSVSLAAMPLLSYPKFDMKTVPVNNPGALLSPVTVPAMLQPLPVVSPGAPAADPAFLASAVDKAPTHYTLGASYVAPQAVRTSFPLSSPSLFAAMRAPYVNPSIQPDARSASSPTPIYIGQSIRKEKRNPSPPIYPLGARLYEQMIPRAEFFLASSTYAEEYLDLVAALYCLFHKWPCNNMQEFAEETRKRQEEMNARAEGEKVVA